MRLYINRYYLVKKKDLKSIYRTNIDFIRDDLKSEKERLYECFIALLIKIGRKYDNLY